MLPARSRFSTEPDPGNSHVGNRFAGPSSKGILVCVFPSKTPGAGVQISCFGLSRSGYLESDKGVSCPYGQDEPAKVPPQPHCDNADAPTLAPSPGIDRGRPLLSGGDLP